VSSPPTAAAGPAAAAAPVYGGIRRRFLATTIDNAVWLVFLVWIAGSIPPDAADPTAVGIVFLVVLTAWFNYFAFAEWRWGQTIGKNAVGLRVTTELGQPLSWNAAAIRNLLRIVDSLPVGPILMLASTRRQRLGDRLAHTVVIRDRPAEQDRGEVPSSIGAATPTGNPAAGPGRVSAAEPPEPPPAGRIFPEAVEALREGPPRRGAESSAEAARVAREAEEPRPEPGDGIGIPGGTWRPAQVLWAVLVVIGLSIVEVLAVSAFDPDLDSIGARLATQALLAATLVAVALGFAARPRPGLAAPGRLGLRGFQPSALGLALAAYGAYILFAAFYAPLVQPEQEDVTRDLGVDQGNLEAIAAGLLIIVAAPISEEIFFRGLMFTGLRRRLSLWPAAAITAILWAALHYTGPESIGVVPQLAVLGLLLAWLYEYTGSLWPPILMHAVNNGLAFAILTAT
jgi:membrane protease YdiL (CAAX protease family)/uncharacterized RDD family membrane protein YckC